MEISFTMGKRPPSGFTATTFSALNKLQQEMHTNIVSTGAYILDGTVLAVDRVTDTTEYEAPDSICTEEVHDEDDEEFLNEVLEEIGSLALPIVEPEAEAEEQVPDDEVASEEPTVTVGEADKPCDTKQPLTFIEVLT